MASAQSPPVLAPLDSSGTITYYVADGIPSFGSRPGDFELAHWAFDEWERSADGLIKLEPIGDEAAALIRLYWLSSSRGQYGQMKPHVANRKPVAIIFVRPDTALRHKAMAAAAANDSLLRDTIVYLSCLHEIGHALGIGHSAAVEDVMHTTGSAANFDRYRRQTTTRTDLARVSWLSDHDKSRLALLYKK